MDKLYIVVPCYKEQEVLPETARRLQQKMEALQQAKLIHRDSRVVFVNDGSTDGTWSLITQLHEQNPLFEGINLSCNRGHQNALLAGLMTVKNYADVTISMDADLQDDIDAVDEMLAATLCTGFAAAELPIPGLNAPLQKHFIILWKVWALKWCLIMPITV